MDRREFMKGAALGVGAGVLGYALGFYRGRGKGRESS